MSIKSEWSFLENYMNPLFERDFKDIFMFQYSGIKEDKFDSDYSIYTWTEENEDIINGIFTSGCTKFVYILNDEDWVIKIPFPDWNTGNFEFDYCRLETKFYERACKKGLEKYFAATFYIGEINGVPIYAQKKIVSDEATFDDALWEYTKSTSKSHVEDYDDENDYLDAIQRETEELDNIECLSAFFGEEAPLGLIDFIEENGINDIHSGNVGFLNGRVVLCDYSGYGRIMFEYE